MSSEQAPRKQDADRLYRQYVKPLEREHKGEYVTVSLQGQTIFAPTLLEALQKADEIFGPRHTVTFKVGARVVGKIR
jgi:hypothetical protein